ncbi:MAG: tetratricopeptide repeat protein [Armatimonadota bacterium]|nr:MAG: hypothetical protein KatS3mg024_1669 [Armatimonadota bacterium]
MASRQRVSRECTARDGENRMLSVCILSQGDADALRQCLKAVDAVSDETLVAFVRSTREARRLVRQSGAAAIDAAGLTPAEARNRAAASATGAWILSLDEDEAPEGISRATLGKTLAVEGADAFLVTLEIIASCGEVTDVFQQRQARLFRNLASLRFERSSLPCVAGTAERHGHNVRVADLTLRRERARPCCGSFGTDIELLRQEAAGHPGDAACLALLGRELYAAGEYQEAADVLRAAAEAAGPAHALSPYLAGLRAMALREAGLAASAIEECDRALESGLSSPEIHFARGWALMALRRPAEAAESFCAAAHARTRPVPWLMREPTIRDYRAMMGAALALLECGRTSAALEWAGQAASRRPDLPETLVLLAIVRDAAGDRRGAVAAMEMALLVDPSNLDALSLAAPWFAAEGRSREAVAAAQRLCAALPDDPAPHIQLAGALVALGESDRAYCAAAKALSLSRGDCGVLMDAGRIFAACGDPAAALRCFQEVITREPSHAEAYFAAGEVTLQAGAFAEAAGIFQLGIRLDGSNAAAHFGLGNALARSGRLQSAVRAWERALELDPAFQEAGHNLRVARRALARAA